MIRQDWGSVGGAAWAILLFATVGPVYVAYGLWNWAIGKRGIPRTVVFGFLVPVVAGVLAVTTLHESVHPEQAVGALLVVGGLVVTRLSTRTGPGRARAEAPDQAPAEAVLAAHGSSGAARTSTGLPPHQWLLRQRVKAAKQLMTVRDLPLSEIAMSAGFANQSHFTRVFSSAVGVSPGVWRREKRGGSENET